MPSERHSICSDTQFPELDTPPNYDQLQQEAVLHVVRNVLHLSAEDEATDFENNMSIPEEFFNDAPDSEDSDYEDYVASQCKPATGKASAKVLAKFVRQLPHCAILDIGFRVFLTPENWVRPRAMHLDSTFCNSHARTYGTFFV
jgi:hypothetical protein